MTKSIFGPPAMTKTSICIGPRKFVIDIVTYLRLMHSHYIAFMYRIYVSQTNIFRITYPNSHLHVVKQARGVKRSRDASS